MSFSFSFITTSGDRAKALTAAQSPPTSVAEFISSAVDAIGVLPDGWLIQVSASGHLDPPAPTPAAAAVASAAAATEASGNPAANAPAPQQPMPMPAAMGQGANISVQPLQITE